MSRPQTESTALSLLTDAEKAAVLDELIAGDVELERWAEQAGLRLLATVTTDHFASAVAEALLALDQDDLAAHAGRTRCGYVEPTDAAWWLLERGLEPWLEALARRARLGLEKAPRQLRLGIVEGLEAVGDHISDDERLQSWGPRLRRRGRRQPPPGLTDVGI